MKQLNNLLITLCVLVFLLAAGVWYFSSKLTPEVLTISQETAKINAETRLEEAKSERIEKAIEYKTRVQELENVKAVKSSWPYRIATSVSYSVVALWPVWMLTGFITLAVSQRDRFSPKVSYKDRDIDTQVTPKAAVKLAETSIKARELESAERVLAFKEDLTHDRFKQGLDTVRTLKSFVKEPKVIETPIVDVPLSIPQRTRGKLTMTDLLQDSDLMPGHLPLGINPETGAICQATPEHLTCIDIVGKQNFCKSTILKMLIIGLFRLQDEGKDMELYLIDPHSGLKGSSGTFLKPVMSRFTKTVLGEKAIKDGEHITLLQDLEKEIDRRQLHGYDTPFLVILIDEVHDIFDQADSAKVFYDAMKRVRRLRKAGIFNVIIHHDSTKEGAGNQGTGLMNLNVSAFVVNATKSKAAKVLEAGDSDKAVNLKRGLAVLKVPTDETDENVSRDSESEVVQLPFVRDIDLAPFVMVSQDTQKTHEMPSPDENVQNKIEQTPVVGEPMQHVTPELCKTKREAMGLSQKNLADETGVSQTKISKFERADDRLSDEEKLAIHMFLYGSKTEKIDNVIYSDKFANRPSFR